MFFQKSYHLIEFPDEFDASAMEAFNKKVEKLVGQKKKAILVDFSNAIMIHSNGLGMLVSHYKLCKTHDTFFGLVHCNQAITSVIQSARLDRILKMFSSIRDVKAKELKDAGNSDAVSTIEFVYHEIFLNGIKMLICEGIMSDGKVFKNFIQQIIDSEQVILDFTNLSFIELNCLDAFNEFCSRTKVYIYGVSEVLEDEFRFFEVKHKFTQASTLKEIIQSLS